MQSKLNVVSGENVQYTYDSLNRLATAETTQSSSVAPVWGNSYSFDGFGNLTDMNDSVRNAHNVLLCAPGSAPSFHTTFGASTNQETGVTYDANGNQGSGSNFDIDNRMIAAGGVTYGYAADNKRLFKSDSSGTRLFFHDASGQRLGEYALNFNSGGTAVSIDLITGNTWFGGKLLKEGSWTVVQDLRGSVRWRKNGSTTETADYFPFGGEKPSATTNDRQKFGTYLRDAESGLDYADQRYFSSATGRFQTADPYQASGGAGDPGSWNRYAYTRGDPVNRHDRSGLCDDPNEQLDSGADKCVPNWPPLGSGHSTSALEECLALHEALYPGAAHSYCYGPANVQTDDAPPTVIEIKNWSSTSKEAVAVQNVVRWLRAAIAEDATCNEWLSSNQDLAGAFAHMLGEDSDGEMRIGVGEFSNSATTNAVAGTGGTTMIPGGADITVNINGGFFSSNYTGGVGTPFVDGSNQAKALIVLHEIAHSVGAKGFIDGDSSRLNQANKNIMVLEKCGNVIGRFK